MRLAEFIRPKQTKVWVCVKGGLCIGGAYVEKMIPVLEPHNSVCPTFCQKPNFSRAGLMGVQSYGASGSPVKGRCQSGLVKGRGNNDPCQQLYNSMCPGFCIYLSRVEPPGVQRVGLVNFS